MRRAKVSIQLTLITFDKDDPEHFTAEASVRDSAGSEVWRSNAAMSAEDAIARAINAILPQAIYTLVKDVGEDVSTSGDVWGRRG